MLISMHMTAVLIIFNKIPDRLFSGQNHLNIVTNRYKTFLIAKNCAINSQNFCIPGCLMVHCNIILYNTDIFFVKNGASTYVFYCFFIWYCLSIDNQYILQSKIKANNTLLEPKMDF